MGPFGKNSDGGIFASCKLGKGLQQGTLSIPADSVLPGRSIEMPYVIVGDEAFSLKTFLRRPYPGQNLHISQHIFNYRLTRARRVVENAFRILSQRFCIYHRRIQALSKNVDNIVLTRCILHNFIKKYDLNMNTNACDTAPATEDRRATLDRLPNQDGNATRDAFRIREHFKMYFNSESGSVP